MRRLHGLYVNQERKDLSAGSFTWEGSPTEGAYGGTRSAAVDGRVEDGYASTAKDLMWDYIRVVNFVKGNEKRNQKTVKGVDKREGKNRKTGV